MQQRFANVIVDITHEKLDRTFQYRIPEHLQGELAAGMAVEVPFGPGNRLIRAYVLSLSDHPEYEIGKLKEIHGILRQEVGVESRLIALAAWMREYYGATMIQALKTVIPVKQKVKPRENRSVRLLVEEEEARERLEFFQRKHQSARARLLAALLEEGELPLPLVTGKLHISSQTIKAMKEQGILSVERVEVYRNPISISTESQKRVTLSPDQQRVRDAILGEWEEKKDAVYLIHGVTGCGKTQIYMELIAHAISKGEQAIVLIPEIALTYQTVMRFYRRFGERITILNSRMSQGERYDQYERAKKGLVDVMIGPRSALFTPFPNLGIVIIDEEHEDSYKSESAPRYHARETAIYRGKLEGARVVLGSATPSLEAYDRAVRGVYTLYTIRERISKRPLPDVWVEDMREELKAGNRSILSRRLAALMKDRLEKGQQMMLFLNRRGYSGFVSCRSCGSVMQCPHCDVALALHKNGRLICHYCGYSQPAPGTCPSCGSEYIRGFRIGTQQVEEYVKKVFPEARVLRMDLDTTRQKDGHAKILSAFGAGEADVLIGTQMIVKGHDFPGVTLVGVLAADLSLHANDYRAGEKTFQLLTQAAGRAGRGQERGEVVIQTYDPENYSIQAAAKQDYESFYRQEMLFRQLAGYPPASGMLAIHGACRDQKQLQLAMDYIGKLVRAMAKRAQAQVIGPADENVAKVEDVYRKILYIKHKNPKILTIIKGKVEEYTEMNEGFRQIQVQFDMYE